MSQVTSPNAEHRRHSPVRESHTPQLRTVRKELLLLRAEVERSEFVRARAELHAKLERFGWLKLLLPRFGSAKTKASGKGFSATLSDLVSHPLVGTLVSMLVAKPLRSKLSAGTKPLLKWGALGAAAWTGYRLLSRTIRQKADKAEAEGEQASS
ncbi:DUF3318 domain-containing protein [Trinickia symbiotica]|uniref:DUF3318 domain-containing protein n=1 Tax=Trinickia symbiotica TaxID=863227 RepID=UPI000D175932|nr:DUF3318 domain-containing protein [Trinickia symbiotica]